MDRAPDQALLDQVGTVAMNVEGVLATEKALPRRVGGQYWVVLHVQADPELTLQEAHDLGGRGRSQVVEDIPSIGDVVIHMEPFEG